MAKSNRAHVIKRNKHAKRVSGPFAVADAARLARLNARLAAKIKEPVPRPEQEDEEQDELMDDEDVEGKPNWFLVFGLMDPDQIHSGDEGDGNVMDGSQWIVDVLKD
ncbi:hypothetical protein FRC02_004266, partial [Tulasnella sp. 418]